MLSHIPLISWCREAILALLVTCLSGCALSQLQAIPLAIEKGATAKTETTWPERADLKEDLFAATRAKEGYWFPDRFFHEVGARIYALENYDPGRTPVLFIHGAKGTPRDWESFVSHLDKTRYQPWFFYYPTGAPVSAMSDILYRQLLELHPGKLYIIAHSQGGLVVRSLLGEHSESLPWIKLFVSISTPWGGESLATMGTRLSPVAVPSWGDLRPNGPFLKSLFTKRLPATTDYYLFFGHRGSRSIARPNNDGTVTLASLLRQQAQAEAKRIYAFEEGHTSILSSQAVIIQCNVLLHAADAATGIPVLAKNL